MHIHMRKCPNMSGSSKIQTFKSHDSSFIKIVVLESLTGHEYQVGFLHLQMHKYTYYQVPYLTSHTHITDTWCYEIYFKPLTNIINTAWQLRSDHACKHTCSLNLPDTRSCHRDQNEVCRVYFHHLAIRSSASAPINLLWMAFQQYLPEVLAYSKE